MDSLLHEGAQNFEVFKIFKNEIKNQKPIAVEVLFKAYPMVPLSCRSIWPDGTFSDPFVTI